MINVMSLPRKGSINRGRFVKYYEVKEGYVRFWGMCDVTAADHEIHISREVFEIYMDCIKNKTYANMRNIADHLNIDEQRFLLDGLSPQGWREIGEAMEKLIGNQDPLFYQGIQIKRIFKKKE